MAAAQEPELQCLDNVRISTTTLQTTFSRAPMMDELDVIDIAPRILEYIKTNNSPIKVINSCYCNGSTLGYEGKIKTEAKPKKKLDPTKPERKKTGNGTTFASAMELILDLDQEPLIYAHIYHRTNKISLIGAATKNNKVLALTYIIQMLNKLYSLDNSIKSEIKSFSLVNFAFIVKLPNTTDIINLRNLSWYMNYIKNPELPRIRPTADKWVYKDLPGFSIVHVNTNVTKNQTNFTVKKVDSEKQISFKIWQSGKVNMSGNNEEHMREFIKFINDSFNANKQYFISETLKADESSESNSDTESESDDESDGE